MDKYYLLEVLNCVFVTNIDAFISFVQCELIFSFWYPKNKQKEKRYGKIKPVVPLSPFKNSIKLESDKLSSDKSPA